MGESGTNVTFNLSFSGLGWHWIGEFVGFIIMFTYFRTQQSLVCRTLLRCSHYNYSDGYCSAAATNEQVCEKDQRGLTGFSAAYAAASMCGVQPINQAEVYKLLVV